MKLADLLNFPKALTTWKYQKHYPTSGSYWKSNGELYHQADWEDIQRCYSVLCNTLNNGASVLSLRAENLAGQTDHYFIFDVPAGRQLVLYSRDLNMSEGSYYVDALSADTVDLTNPLHESITGTLNWKNPTTVQSKVYHKTTGVSGVTVREQSFVDSGTGVGSARASGALSIEKVFKVIVGRGILRVRKIDSADTFTANLSYIVWEEDIPA